MITLETESGSIYELDLDSNPQTFSRNGGYHVPLIDYRFYNTFWRDRPKDEAYDTNLFTAAGKYLFVHGKGVNDWFDTTQIIKVAYA